jgi:hypothetical protein
MWMRVSRIRFVDVPPSPSSIGISTHPSVAIGSSYWEIW